MSESREPEARPGHLRQQERERRRLERRRLLAGGPVSPCIGVCRLDDVTGWCVGCFRTIDEIRDWMIMAPDERRAVLSRVAGRRAAAGR
ncbi:MAG: DUF1289 domain-containing protein [Rhodospirillaceae bacterium]|nr:DUF1289 domain-containing protein [Rhodospirillaceae bacterium]